VVNKGLRHGSFRINVDGPDWAHVSADSFFLVPDQEERFYLYLSPPYGTAERDYDITVSAISGKAVSGATVKASVSAKAQEGGEGAVTGEDGNATGNATAPDGITGMFIDYGSIPLEAVSMAILAIAAVTIIILRFVVFR
jgi:hypothetical protein